MMNPYSFYPDVLQRTLFGVVNVELRLDFIFPPDADTPRMGLKNTGVPTVTYASEWRHITP